MSHPLYHLVYGTIINNGVPGLYKLEFLLIHGHIYKTLYLPTSTEHYSNDQNKKEYKKGATTDINDLLFWQLHTKVPTVVSNCSSHTTHTQHQISADIVP